MYPYLKIGERLVPTYGIMIALAFVLGIILCVILCRVYKLGADDGIYIYVLSALFAVIGGKIVYLICEAPNIIEACQGMGVSFFLKNYISSGFSIMGVVPFGIAGAVVSAKFFGRLADEFIKAFVPAMALTVAVSRAGCILAGCCYGVEFDGKIGIVFKHSVHAPNGVKLFPTQIVDFILCIILLVIVAVFIKKNIFIMKLPYLYLLMLSVFRFVTEFFRGDTDKVIAGIFSVIQLICLLYIVFSIVKIRRRVS